MNSLRFNPDAATSHRLLGGSDAQFRRSVTQLSSGLRINSAADDAAGLQISEKLRNQVRGLQQAARNAQDGVSLIQTAEGGLSQVHAMLQRMRELAVQSANGTLTNGDRDAIQTETDQLVAEIDRMAQSVDFNGFKLLGGGANRTAEQMLADGLRSQWLRNAENRISQYYGIQGDDTSTFDVVFDQTGGSAPNNPAYCTTTSTGIEMHFNMDYWTDGVIDGNVATSTNNPNFQLPNGGIGTFTLDRTITHELTHGVMFTTLKAAGVLTDHWWMEGTAEFSHGADDRVASDALAAGSVGALIGGTWDTWAGGGTSAEYSGAYLAVKYLESKLLTAGKDIKNVINDLRSSTSDMDTALTNNIGMDEATFIADFKANGAAWAATSLNLTDSDTGSIAGSDYGNAALDYRDTVADIPASFNNPLLHYRETDWPAGNTTLQVGANTVSNVDTLDLPDVVVTAAGLGIQGLDVTTAAGALDALDTIDNAVEVVSDFRSSLGAAQNRLEYTLMNLGAGTENQATAESRIRDADVASATSTMVKTQILRQMGAAMLAQANAAPQTLLGLLR